MIKINTIFMPYVEYTVKGHKKAKKKIQGLLKKSSFEPVINSQMHLNQTDYLIPWTVPRPYQVELIKLLDPPIQYMTKSLGYLSVDIPNLFYVNMKKNDATDWGTYNCNFVGVYAFDMPDKKFELKWFNSIEKKVNVLTIKEGDILFFPSYLSHAIMNLGKTKSLFIFSLNFSKGQNIERWQEDVEKK